MPQSADDLSILATRASIMERAARSCLDGFGGALLPTRLDLSNKAEPSLWLRNDVLVTFGVDAIVVGRIAQEMTHVEELSRFPAEAVLDAAKFAVVETVTRAVSRSVERLVMDQK